MIVLFIICLTFIFSYGIGNASAASISKIYVSTDGNDSWNGQYANFTNGTNGPKATITNATGTVADNGTIYIQPGTYNQYNITINKNISIISDNQKNTIINGVNSDDSIFIINPNDNVLISNLTITHGSITTYNGGVGGAITNYGFLTIINSTISNNTAIYVAGAIYNWGTLNIINSTFINNNAISTNWGGGHGGAILNDGILTTTGTIFINNNAVDNGGAIYNDGTLNITGDIFNQNTANTWGGGAISNYGLLYITNSILTNNSANYGGAIFNYQNTTIIYSQIYGNTANTGSAIDSESGVVNAIDNYWNNSNPGNYVNGDNITVTPWLTTPLMILNINPSNNTINLPINQEITIQFNEPIKIGDMPITLQNNNGTNVPFNSTINGTLLTITPTILLMNNTRYNLTLMNDSLTDYNDNQLTYYKSSFTTAPQLIIYSINPINNAVNINTNTSIQVTFNEPIISGNNFIQLLNKNISIPFNSTINSTVLTIQPLNPLNNDTKYTLILHTGSIKNNNGNILLLTTETFSTGPPPIIANQILNTMNNTITLSFNEPIKEGFSDIQLINNNGMPETFTMNTNAYNLTLITQSYHYIIYLNPIATPNYDINAMKSAGITDVFMQVSPNPGDSNYYATYLPQIKPLFDAANITLYAWILPDFTPSDVSKITAMNININLDLEYFNDTFPSTEYVTNYVKSIQAACNGRIFTVAMNPNAPYVDSGATYGVNYNLLAKYTNAIVPLLFMGNYKLDDATMQAAAAYMQKLDPGKLWIALQTYQSDSNPVTLSVNNLLKQINDVKANANELVGFRYGLSNFEDAISTLTINSNNCTLILHGGSITDTLGNPIPNTSLKLTYNNTPHVTSTNPPANATDVSLTAPVTITFNENITTGANFSGIYIKNLITGNIVSIASKKITGNTLTITTTLNHLANDTYQVYIPVGAVKDTLGNNLSTAYTIKFTIV